MLKYRGVKIPQEYYTIGCIIFHTTKEDKKTYSRGLIDVLSFFPNGTGPGNAHPIVEFILNNIPSDKYQIEGSNPHDLCYTIGGSRKDKNKADKIMFKFAKKAVFKKLKFYDPRRYWYWAMMKRNYWAVKYMGDDSFNFNEHDFSLENFNQKKFDHFKRIIDNKKSRS
jgi:hypothetical protein